MTNLFEIAYNVISPIFIIVGISALVYRKFQIDSRSLSKLVIYLFTPFTIFKGIAFSDLSGGEAARLAGVAVISSLIVAFIAWRVARAAGYDPRLESAFMLSATLINAGNYGLPVNRFAFGAEGEERALVYFVGTVVVSYTLGVFLASRGTVSTRRAILNVFTIPLPYMVVLGLIVNLGNIKLPLPVERSVILLDSATIPCMLVILGIQLTQASIKGRVSAMLMASGLRLIVSPLITLALALLLGLSGLARQVSIVQAAMPTAIVTGVIAAEFGADKEFVTATILLDTLLSLITLSIVLAVV